MLRVARSKAMCCKVPSMHCLGRRRRGVSGEGGERQGEPLLLCRAGRRPLDAGAPQGAAGSLIMQDSGAEVMALISLRSLATVHALGEVCRFC